MRITNCLSGRTASVTNSCDTRSGFFAVAAPLLLSMIFFWPFGGGTKVPMNSGKVDPAAQGTVIFHTTGNNNVNVDTKVKFLANPSSLTPPESIYVVWFQPTGEAPVNEGASKVDKNLNGELKTVTPYKRFTVFVTAEKSAQVKMPSGPQVLTANVAQG